MLNLTGIPALDLAIGLALIYFLLSTLAATVQEFIAAIFGLRARTLEQGLRSMLEDPDKGWTYVDKFYDHPLIKSLYRTPSVLTEKGKKTPESGVSGRNAKVANQKCAAARCGLLQAYGWALVHLPARLRTRCPRQHHARRRSEDDL